MEVPLRVELRKDAMWLRDISDGGCRGTIQPWHR